MYVPKTEIDNGLRVNNLKGLQRKGSSHPFLSPKITTQSLIIGYEK